MRGTHRFSEPAGFRQACDDPDGYRDFLAVHEAKVMELAEFYSGLGLFNCGGQGVGKHVILINASGEMRHFDSANEAAAELGCSPSWITRLAASGKEFHGWTVRKSS